MLLLRLVLQPTVSCLLLLPIFAGCSATDHPDVRGVLESQQAAWNNGDLAGFMEGYWKSDELVFSTPEGETRGWQATLDRYESRYGSREKMGELTFSRLTIARPTPETAEVSGQYRVAASDGVKTGRFYLRMRRIEGRWVIVRDHTVPDSVAGE